MFILEHIIILWCDGITNQCLCTSNCFTTLSKISPNRIFSVVFFPPKNKSVKLDFHVLFCILFCRTEPGCYVLAYATGKAALHFNARSQWFHTWIVTSQAPFTRVCVKHWPGGLNHGVPKLDCYIITLFREKKKGPCKYFFLYGTRFVQFSFSSFFWKAKCFVTFIIGVPRPFRLTFAKEC